MTDTNNQIDPGELIDKLQRRIAAITTESCALEIILEHSQEECTMLREALAATLAEKGGSNGPEDQGQERS